MKRDLQEMLDKNLIQVTRDRNEDEHEVNVIVPRFNLPEPVVIAYDSHKIVLSPLFNHLAGLTPYKSDKAMPYKYNAIIVKDDKKVPIPVLSSVENIADVSGLTQSGRVFVIAAPRKTKDVVIEKLTQEKTPVVQACQS